MLDRTKALQPAKPLYAGKALNLLKPEFNVHVNLGAMRSDRRVFLKVSTVAGTASIALLCGKQCWASWEVFDFTHSQADKAMLDLLAGEGAIRSDRIQIDVPQHHQNKALVPVAVTTTLPEVRAISILIDSPFDPLAATFQLGARHVGRISTRLRLEQSSRIWAFVETESGYAVSDKPVVLVPFSSKTASSKTASSNSGN